MYVSFFVTSRSPKSMLSTESIPGFEGLWVSADTQCFGVGSDCVESPGRVEGDGAHSLRVLQRLYCNEWSFGLLILKHTVMK